ncbi:MAG: NAD(P)H-dependent oxidoreductase [Lewinellaceae bacterium]|nr:NAD(P)H-dependent oxidoreductase [Lewinella sp.]MCB9278047.1 NAD(P)H-dependent oxidoreductase [Lewinellaceae bacterium]
MEPTKKRILAVSGSTRLNSANGVILQTIADLYRRKSDIHIYPDLAALPHFDPGLDEAETPDIVLDFHRQIAQSDGVIICTPEYVFSLPAVLKNAIEWTVATTLFSNKPVALITASSSGEKAHESLIMIMKTLYARVEDEACLLIRGVKSKIGVDKQISDPVVLNKINSTIEAFLKMV